MNAGSFILPEEYSGIEETISELKNDITRLFVDAEEKVLKQVVEQVVGREPTTEDYKEFTIIHTTDDPNNYSLAHKGKCIGVVRRYFEGLKYRVDFIPNKIKL